MKTRTAAINELLAPADLFEPRLLSDPRHRIFTKQGHNTAYFKPNALRAKWVMKRDELPPPLPPSLPLRPSSPPPLPLRPSSPPPLSLRPSSPPSLPLSPLQQALQASPRVYDGEEGTPQSSRQRRSAEDSAALGRNPRPPSLPTLQPRSLRPLRPLRPPEMPGMRILAFGKKGGAPLEDAEPSSKKRK